MRRTASAAPELPGYEYRRLLGAGGFSDVFLYQQQLPRRQVAVKVLLAEELTAAARKAFVDEANLMAQLSAHPFIVTIYGADIAEGLHPYFVMEYCSGPSLSERYKRERFSAADALRTGVRLASAIATAHAAGILHRDIKPANVLTNDYGWPALTDFGISSAVDELPVQTTTAGALRAEEGATGGTGTQSVGLSVPWSPPEMFADDPNPDVRSDVFSLAATIWTLLAGRTPFEQPGRGNGALDLIGRIERGRITPMDRDDVPRSLVAVLQKGMSPRREDRWATAVEFARALQRVELELGYAPTTIDVPALAGEAAPEPEQGDADETRMRSVATIDAQPVNAPPTISPAGGAGAAGRDASTGAGVADGGASDDGDSDRGNTDRGDTDLGNTDATRLRGVATVSPHPDERRGASGAAGAAGRPSAVDEGTVLRPAVHQPDPEPAAPTLDSDEPAPPRRRLPLVPALVGAGVLVLIAMIVVSIALVGTGANPGSAESPRASGGSALGGDTVPSPKFLSATPAADGSTVTFTFAPVNDAEGYRWAPSEQDDATQGVEQPVVTQTVPSPGARVCVKLAAVRDGDTSEPTEACYPR